MKIPVTFGVDAGDLIGKQVFPSLFEGPLTVTGVNEERHALEVTTPEGRAALLPVKDTTSLLIAQ